MRPVVCSVEPKLCVGFNWAHNFFRHSDVEPIARDVSIVHTPSPNHMKAVACNIFDCIVVDTAGLLSTTMTLPKM